MKKKAAIIILTAFLIASMHHSIYSQNNYNFNINRTVVIAANGLNMRSKPNTKSTKLVNIPYGEKITILHRDHYGLDTLYIIKSDLRDHPVYGFWQKIQYGDDIGYVHNAFLSIDFPHRRKLPPGINQDFIYLRPGYDCADQFYNTNEYIWYGYYQEETTPGSAINKPYRKQIDVEFINVAADMAGSGTIVKNDRHLKFIIGSKKVFPESEMENILERPLYERIDNNNLILDTMVVKEGHISMVRDTEPAQRNQYPFFYLNHGEEMQLINKTTENHRIFDADTFIQADLDGDGVLDYIFVHDNDTYARGLYLSSEANEEEIVKLVSILERGPCC